MTRAAKLCIVSSSYEELAPLVEKVALQAYDCMAEWFGPPADEQRPYEIVPHRFTACAEALLLGRYLLFIDQNCTEEAKLAALISHEMYHRVTMRRRTLRRQAWADELLAYLASQQFLETQGYTAYAREIEANWQREKIAVDFSTLYRARSKRVLFGLRGVAYPPGFGGMVTKLARALDMLLAWEDLCSLARVQSIEAFYDALPTEDQPWVRAVMTSQDDPQQVLVPDASSHSEEDLDTYVWLAKAYYEMRHLKAAKAVLESVLGILPDHAFALRNLARTLEEQGDNAAAKEIYEKALWLDQDNAYLHYNYGCVLNRLGHTEQACAQWRQVVRLDTTLAVSARTALWIVGHPMEAEEQQETSPPN